MDLFPLITLLVVAALFAYLNIGLLKLPDANVRELTPGRKIRLLTKLPASKVKSKRLFVLLTVIGYRLSPRWR